MSRTNARSKRLRRRPSRTIPATIVAVVLTAAGALTALSGVLRLTNGRWPTQVSGPATTAAALTWGSAALIVAAAVLTLIGLILLIAALKPGHPTTARLNVNGDTKVADTDFVISTRAMARLAAAQADTVDGVEKISTSATGKRVRLQITTSSRQTREIQSRVVNAVTDTLRSSGVDPLPKISAAVHTKEI